MKRLLIFTSIFTLLLSTLIFAEKKQWKQPKLKEGQTIQEAFEELRQNRNQKQETIQKRKDSKRASKSEAIKEKKYRGFDFSNKYDKKQEKKKRRAKASESQIDRLDPRKFNIDFLEPRDFENVLLGGNKDEVGKNRKEE